MERFLGKLVLNDISNSRGVTIIPAQTVIDRDAVRLMINHKISMESIAVALDIPEVPISSPELAARKLTDETVEISKELFESIKSSRKIPLMEIRKDVLPAIHSLSKNPNLFELFETVKAKDDYTYQHNVGVGILATLIGRWMGLNDLELSMLSLAAVLHDVGKVKIPKEILNKPGKLTTEEFQEIKKHTIYGYEMLKETKGLNIRIANVALQHHERNDGTGYPLGLKKEQLDPFSSIVAVADIFHAMSSKRPYHEPIPFYEIVSQMRQGKFGELDPQIVSVFIENIMKRLIGEQVVLTDGRKGEVVYLNPQCIEQPLIKVEDEFFDLSKEKELQIQEIIVG
ncbi:HD-GYP domain-containing protein [Cohnella endophytica]|uniref:HD-GYP domain-containing protein n=1 Tax=Cohnella endophytica TaxID=2419778 RepID=A0A494Y1I1_9BACL|nr:HD-GYP domain-containing protein [Cohnella endophytica]RKP56101.1 HD-GYP domain-containing protein [Cohnella endophytica]